MIAPDFTDVRGQLDAIEACVAAAARHARDPHAGLLLEGPPGTGKTMIARRVSGLIAPLTEHAHRWLTAEYEFLGATITSAPFRAPHHTVSAAALAGAPWRAGRDLVFCRCKGTAAHRYHDLPRWVVPPAAEVHLARFGVLFLDELTEFSGLALSTLGSALRAMGETAPMIVAATNRCPCGWFGGGARECSCSDLARQRYTARITAAIKAIGVSFTVGYVDPMTVADMRTAAPGPSTADLRAQVARRAGGAS